MQCQEERQDADDDPHQELELSAADVVEYGPPERHARDHSDKHPRRGTT